MTSGIESKVDAGVAAVNQKLVVTKDETDKALEELEKTREKQLGNLPKGDIFSYFRKSANG